MARGTVVGWAPQRDTGSARIRWWSTAESLPLGVARGQGESRPGVTPSRTQDLPGCPQEISRSGAGDGPDNERLTVVSCFLATRHV